MAELRELIQGVYDANGRLTPELVLDTARDPGHPLHSRFEWDDSVAAERHRRDQAHRLIRSVRVVYKQGTETSAPVTGRAFHAVRSAAGPTAYEYRPAEEVAKDPFLAQLALREMERQWKELHRKYGAFVEFRAMVQADLGDEERPAA